MSDALAIAATGMKAQQFHLDTVAHNLANLKTNGFKAGRVQFFDLMGSRAMAQAELGDIGLSAMPAGSMGLGVGVGAMSRFFGMGELQATDSAFDLAVRGEGFLEVLLPDGRSAYTRGGSLTMDAQGLLSTAEGHPLKAGIHLPVGMQRLVLEPDGQVLAQVAGQTQAIDLGRLDLVQFANPQGLIPWGDGLYVASAAAGEPRVKRPGEEGLGTMAQGHLEASNVKMIDEMLNLMVAQRSYEANVKVAQAADEVLGLINGLRR